ncbi:MAG: hypothetical protein ABIO45_06760, partial [Burkholderiaceae bacterium]
MRPAPYALSSVTAALALAGALTGALTGCTKKTTAPAAPKTEATSVSSTTSAPHDAGIAWKQATREADVDAAF